MKITKLGHCCLLIEVQGVRILTDPGSFSTAQNEVQEIDVVLITHEHADHLHIDSLKEVLRNNPQSEVITNTAVAALLDEAGIPYILLNDKEIKEVSGISVEAYEAKHAEMYPGMPRVLNTGFFIDAALFYPGDAFIEPNKEVDILALPVVGPWMKLSEGIDYALRIHPRVAFPVHDGILKQAGMVHKLPKTILEEAGITFVAMNEGDTQEF